MLYILKIIFWKPLTLALFCLRIVIVNNKLNVIKNVIEYTQVIPKLKKMIITASTVSFVNQRQLSSILNVDLPV